MKPDYPMPVDEPKTPSYARSIQWMLEYEKPENTDTVLIVPKDDEICLGYWCDETERWWMDDEETLLEDVLYWAHLPALP